MTTFATAAALRATNLLLLSNIPGVLADFPDENSLIHTIGSTEIDDISENFVQGRMRIKLLGAKEALAAGVNRVIIGDARGKKAFTANGMWRWYAAPGR